jgi:hypothetical protein
MQRGEAQQCGSSAKLPTDGQLNLSRIAALRRSTLKKY